MGYFSRLALELEERAPRREDISYVTEYLLLYHALSQTADCSGHILHTAGGMTGSLPVFLLGQSTVNPLPAHNYCPECGWHEVSEAKFGLDMELTLCPSCGAPVRRDGFGIAPEMVWDSRTLAKGPACRFFCSDGFLPFAAETVRGFYEPQGRAVLPLGAVTSEDAGILRQIGVAVLPPGKTLRDYPQFFAYLSDGTPCLCGESWKLTDEGIGRIVIKERPLPTALQRAQSACGVFISDMLPSLPGVTAKDITNTMLVSERERIALCGDGQSYYDMACLLALPNNDYAEDCFELLETPEWKACPLYFREEVFDELVSRGFRAVDAARAAGFIRRGQAHLHPERMEEMNLPRHLRDTAVHCIYLLPRASGAQWLVSLMLLARYMQRDPAAFFRVLADQSGHRSAAGGVCLGTTIPAGGWSSAGGGSLFSPIRSALPVKHLRAGCAKNSASRKQ